MLIGGSVLLGDEPKIGWIPISASGSRVGRRITSVIILLWKSSAFSVSLNSGITLLPCESAYIYTSVIIPAVVSSNWRPSLDHVGNRPHLLVSHLIACWSDDPGIG